MDHPLLGSEYRVEDGAWVHAKHQRVAELLYDLDPDLEVQYIPVGNREVGDQAFRIVHHQADGQIYAVMYLDEDQMDHRVVAAMIYNRLPDSEQTLEKWLELQDLSRDAVEQKRAEEAAGERAELALAILKSPKNRYRHGGVVYE